MTTSQPPRLNPFWRPDIPFLGYMTRMQNGFGFVMIFSFVEFYLLFLDFSLIMLLFVLFLHVLQNFKKELETGQKKVHQPKLIKSTILSNLDGTWSKLVKIEIGQKLWIFFTNYLWLGISFWTSLYINTSLKLINLLVIDL